MCPSDPSSAAAPEIGTTAVTCAPPSRSPRARGLSRWLLLAGFALAIFGAKLWLINLAGSDLPWWDQWDAEAEMTLKPWLEGKLTPSLILHPHNEHRLVLTKLYALGLFVANGQWDARLETVCNAAIHTGCALALLMIGGRFLTGGWLGVFAALLFLLFALPFAPDNTLVGFQIQFYLLLLLAVGHLWLTLRTDCLNVGWAVGQLCGLLTLGTMASGFLSSLAVIGVLSVRLVQSRHWSRQQIAGFFLATVIVSTGLLTMTTVEGHEPYKAHTAGQFGFALLHLLAWPGTDWFPVTLVLAVPALCFAAKAVCTRSFSPRDGALFGLVLWSLLQNLALAYGRSGFGTASVLTNRYLDLLSAQVAIGLISLVHLFTGRIRKTAAALWLLLAVIGLIQQTRGIWHSNIAPNIPRDQRREDHVRDYVQTGDPSHLLNKRFGELPYPDGTVLLQRLAPSIQAVLPASVRRPVPVLARRPEAPFPPEFDAPISRQTLSTWSAKPTSAGFWWQSAPQVDATLPVLLFRIAGDLGTPGRALRLVLKSAQGEVEIRPDTTPGLHWKTVQVFRPDGEWWIEAEDADASAWFAFAEPVEVGRWSWLAAKMVKHHVLILAAAVGLLVAGASAAIASRRASFFDIAS